MDRFQQKIIKQFFSWTSSIVSFYLRTNARMINIFIKEGKTKIVIYKMNLVE